ncbi:hypothetical protein [Photobacterium marinum]|uniref:hypothetical protein n=1 Tax=Photobacterium marinum TaxID=1056511 RepID=UPI0005646ABF|nr:hypothetical protein [Photobacterium marinum]
MEIKTARQIHAVLMIQGESCRSWALKHGYKPRTVQKYVQWFAPETGRKPQRKTAIQIMTELSRTLGTDLVGGEDNE